MKFSGIGGQAVLEGIMMRNGKKYAIAVRKPDGDIALKVEEQHTIMEKHAWMRWPFIRGIFSFVTSMVIGIKTISYSASFYEDDGTPKATLPEDPIATESDETAEEVVKSAADVTDKAESPTDEKAEKKAKAAETAMLAGTLVLSLALAIGLFSLLPVLIASPIKKLTDSYFVLALAEGLVRIAIFIGYVWAISLMKDIKRTYMYHGAEHKCINCVEHGLPLTVENVRESSKEHKRCGTSFLLIVMVISVFIFMFIRVDNIFLRLLSRILMIPVIAGISFEFLQFAGRSESCIMNVLSRPGMWLQGLTTRQPDDSMIEVAIKATEAVFDWREFLGLPADYGKEPEAEDAPETEEIVLPEDVFEAQPEEEA